MDQGGTASSTSGTGAGAEAVATPRWLDEDEQRTWRAFMLSHQLLFEQFERDLQRDAGLPVTYYEILVRLSEAPDHRLRMSELADRSQSSRSRLSHAVARLEESGWVRRESCPTDRRGSEAVLTDEGYAALEAAAPSHVQSVRIHLFDPLSDEQLDALATSARRSSSTSRAAGLVCDGAVELPAAATAPGAP